MTEENNKKQVKKMVREIIEIFNEIPYTYEKMFICELEDGIFHLKNKYIWKGGEEL